jgi:hypothetical protein
VIRSNWRTYAVVDQFSVLKVWASPILAHFEAKSIYYVQVVGSEVVHEGLILLL